MNETIVKRNQLSSLTPKLLDQLIELRNQKKGKSLQIIVDHLTQDITVVEAARRLGVKDTTTASKTLKSLILIHNRALDYATEYFHFKTEDFHFKEGGESAPVSLDQWDKLIVLRNQRKGPASDELRQRLVDGVSFADISRDCSQALDRVVLCHERAISYAEAYIAHQLTRFPEYLQRSEVKTPDTKALLVIDSEYRAYKLEFKPSVYDAPKMKFDKDKLVALQVIHDKLSGENTSEKEMTSRAEEILKDTDNLSNEMAMLFSKLCDLNNELHEY
ncbi:hypothetical protein [Vibrio sp. D431a]|uniref:hypothetical protein n=1 Tax=Vibrio sp. D431a TaxID=2837388 RepID=UPI0025554165|nr:hypothetical protein [Vibrio sp. D431a]MDK9789792.1 hypothetical protein [Vibrio sp. D431a]